MSVSSGAATDSRPRTVTAASVITLIFSSLSALRYGGLEAFVLVDAAEALVLRNIAADSYGEALPLVGVFLVWCAIACILAVMVLRRYNAARIMLVVSSAVTALLSLFFIGSGGSAITLLAAVAVIVLLFAGGANDWFKGRGQRPAIPGMPQY